MSVAGVTRPAALEAITADTAQLGFSMGSDEAVGALLRALAATAPAGDILELGAGTGLATAWLLDGMGAAASLTSVEFDASAARILRRHLGYDPRLAVVEEDGDAWIGRNLQRRFQLIFADTWPGKYRLLDETLGMLAPGGMYVVDDMLPQANWPEGHESSAARLAQQLLARPDLAVAMLDVASGVIVATRRG